MLKVGDQAPEFKLTNSEKEEVSLSDFKGKKVGLLFFPLAFSGVCTKELCMVRDALSHFNNIEAEILAISVDSPFALEAFKEKEKLQFKLLSDFNKEVIKSYDVVHEDFAFGMKEVGKRAVFVLDEDHKITYLEIMENPGDLPDLMAAKDALMS